MAELSEKAREEFFSEAQEILEGLSQTLLRIDASLKSGALDPALVNDAFRAVHTLKGLAGLFGAMELNQLAHRLEDLLDDLRLGRLELGTEVLDLLFSGVEAGTLVLRATRANQPMPNEELSVLSQELERIGTSAARRIVAVGDYELEASLLAVLTEYEEHRLRACIEQKLNLYRVRVEFDLITIDRALDEIKERAKKHGEIVSYLPTGSSNKPDSIELDLLLASRDDLKSITQSLGGEKVSVEQFAKRAPAEPLFHQKISISPQPKISISPQPKISISRAAPPFPSRLPESPGDGGAALNQMGSLRSLTQTVRVDIRRLDHLMNIVGELNIVRGALSSVADRLRLEGKRRLSTELHRLHRLFDRRLAEMQSGILEVRMVPLGQVFERLSRIVRQISHEVEKEIRLVITGSETEIDKLIVEELSDPLMHIVRNAIDHGIESAEERLMLGKPAAGTIAINAFQKGNHVIIEVEDDGRGIDQDNLVQRALELGKLEPASAGELSREEALALIFLPGLSTRREADDVSGRGVGMDVVKTNISRIGGIVDVSSELGIATRLSITLPITLAIVGALLVRVSDQTYAIPLASVSEAVVFDPTAVRQVDGREVTSLRGATLPICRLFKFFGFGASSDGAHRGRGFVVIVTLGQRRLGLVVDHVLGQQDIVIKPLGRSLSSVHGFAGVTELGDQRVGLVIDPAALIEEMLVSADGSRSSYPVASG